MAFCGSCGAPMEGRFCAKCGAMAGATPPAPAPMATGAAGAGAGTQAAPATGGLSENGASALCYLFGFVTGVLFLVLEPYNKNRSIRFHAFQSIFLNITVIAVWIGLTIISVILGAILGSLGMFGIIGLLFSLLHLVVWLGSVGLWIFMMIKASQGQKVVLPIIGPLAEKQA